MLRKSCPDLRIPDSGAIVPKNMEICRAQNRIRRAHEKKQAALWKKKPIVVRFFEIILYYYCLICIYYYYQMIRTEQNRTVKTLSIKIQLINLIL